MCLIPLPVTSKGEKHYTVLYVCCGPSLFISLPLSLSPNLSLPLYLSISLSISLPLPLLLFSLSVTLSLSLSLPFFLSLCLSPSPLLSEWRGRDTARATGLHGAMCSPYAASRLIVWAGMRGGT